MLQERSAKKWTIEVNVNRIFVLSVAMIDILFVPISERLEDISILTDHPHVYEVASSTIEYYKKIGFHFPWIGYLALINGQAAGSGGFKGPPKENKVELAYGCFEEYQQRGIATAICKKLIEIALDKQSNIIITARTLPDNTYSQRVLEKNGFVFEGMVTDTEDGEVIQWQWLPDFRTFRLPDLIIV